MIHAAVSFTPDTYGRNSQALGRRIANMAFLRAAIGARAGEPVVGYGYEQHHSAEFAELVHSIRPDAEIGWLLTTDIEELAAQKVMHRLDIAVQPELQARGWAGLGRYSITAVTHTIFNALPRLGSLLRDPWTPWDALICTSRSVQATVAAVLEAETEYARWRYGADVAPKAPQLPVIPLGVHTEDFTAIGGRREHARSVLGIAHSEVVALFVGRLSLMSKAHPGQMYQGLQAAAGRSGSQVTLIECGWPKTDNDREAFSSGPQLLAPNVKHLLVDGNNPDARSLAWEAADIFVSLSDNIQETFGLAPLEAMAAGLPVVASDWDGYRDTVRDGVDGFLIPTWAPAPKMGNHLAFAHQGQTITDDRLSWGVAAATSVDPDRLVAALSKLIANPSLRREMGAAGRKHARTTFDWSHVYKTYQALWADLDARRHSDGQQQAQAPRSGGQLEPFTAFAAYSTHKISGETVVALRAGATLAAYQQLAGHALFPSGAAAEVTAVPLWRLLERGPQSLSAAAEALGQPLRGVVIAAGVLAKMGFAGLSCR